MIAELLIDILSTPFVSKEITSAVPADKPVFVLPLNSNDGAAADPALRVIIPAAKLPVPSRNTIVLGVLALVAVVAELATLPVVLIVANLVSTIAADADTSAFTIRELDKLPDESLCTTPAVVNALIETVPPEDIAIRSNALVLNDNSPALADNPEVVLPVNTNDGNAVVPAGNCNVPVMVSPALSTLLDALPVKLAVIVPAAKLPEASRATIVLGVFVLVASVPMVISSALVVIDT